MFIDMHAHYGIVVLKIIMTKPKKFIYLQSSGTSNMDILVLRPVLSPSSSTGDLLCFHDSTADKEKAAL